MSKKANELMKGFLKISDGSAQPDNVKGIMIFMRISLIILNPKLRSHQRCGRTPWFRPRYITSVRVQDALA